MITSYDDLKELGFIVFPDGGGDTRYHFEVPDGMPHFDTLIGVQWDKILGGFTFFLQNYSYGAVDAYDLPLTHIETVSDLKELITTIEKFI